MESVTAGERQDLRYLHTWLSQAATEGGAPCSPERGNEAPMLVILNPISQVFIRK